MTAVVVNLVTQPRTFVAMSRVLVQPRGEETGAVSVKIAGYDPYFMQTQMEIIKSDAVLRNVVYQLGLARSMAAAYDIKTEFSASDAVEMLRRQLQLSQSRNTSLLEIRVFSASSSQAEAIANAIPMQYASIAPHARMSIIDPARAPLRPVRPNVPLVLISGFIASASLSIVASFLLRFLLRRSFTRTLHPSAA
jgi:uncharacterized protein involved in exopolysaccharide biosynthesis